MWQGGYLQQENDRIVLLLLQCNTLATPMQQIATLLQRRYRVRDRERVYLCVCLNKKYINKNI